MKRIFKILIILFSILAILLFSALFLSLIFEDRIANYAISELNKQIKTPIKVEKTDFTLIRKFPNATIRLRNVYVHSVKEDYEENQFIGINTDTLLFARDIFLQFNLIKLLKNQYIIKEVQITSGNINVFTDLGGNNNYKFWNASGNDKSSDFNIKLNQVKISDLEISQMNLAKKSYVDGELKKVILQGDLSSDKYIMDFVLNGKIHSYSSDETTYLSEKDIIIRSKMDVTDNKFNIIKSNVQIEGQVFNVDGNITGGEEPNLDLTISGSALNLEQILENLSFLYPENAGTKMKVKGNLTFNAKISGPLSNTRIPAIESEFSLSSGLINTHLAEKRFENINLKGYISNGIKQSAESTILKFEGITLNYGNSKFAGNLEMKNLLKPQINYQLNAELNIVDITPFIKTDNIKFNSGIITINTKIRGEQEKVFKISKKDIIDWDFDGTVELEEVMINLLKSDIIIKNINGNIDLSKYLYLNNLSMVISGNELNFKGRIDNYIEYIFNENVKLWMDLNIYSPNLIMDSLFYSKDQNELNSDSILVILPDDIYVKSKLWFDEFNYKKFSAKNMFGELNYKPGSLLFNTVFLSMGGEVNGDGFIEQQNDGNYAVKINSSLEKIDIRDLFYYFNNFGQTYLQDKHLKGQLSGTVNYFSLFDPYMTVKKESILAESEIKITNGELIEFEPMLGLSNFIEVEELKHIKFSTLENQIFIRNSEVLIPQMDIYSSALNLSGSGIHGFNNQFNYKISLELSDLILNKSRQENSEFEEHLINDDGLNKTKIFLTIEGNPDNYKINYDKKAAIGALKEKLTDEKAEMKSLLKDEFGFFSKDSIPVKESESEEKKFFIEWEESVVDSTEKLKSGIKEKTDKFNIEWDDEESDTVEQIDNIKKIKK